jgi:multidrug resistance protein
MDKETAVGQTKGRQHLEQETAEQGKPDGSIAETKTTTNGAPSDVDEKLEAAVDARDISPKEARNDGGEGGDDAGSIPGVDADGLVGWDSDSDPENPQNWPTWRKVTNAGLISLTVFVTPLASSVFAPAVRQMMADFGSDNVELSAFVVSIFVLGFAFGPMLMAPLSEVYGRVPIYHVANCGCVVFTVACALAPNLGALVTFRFFAGFFGSAPLTNGGGSIADMFNQQQRTAAMSAFSLGPLVGPIIGPIIGGIVADGRGWRWVFWVVAIVSGAVTLIMVFTMRESFAPLLLERKAARLRKETGNPGLRSKLATGSSTGELFKRALVRPAKLLIFSPICTVFAVYLMVMYGYLYLLFTSIPYVFQKTYDFETKITGLVYLGMGIGSFIGIGCFGFDSSRELKKRKEIDAGAIDGTTNVAKPEIRLKLLPAAAIIFPIGFFIYGWTTDYRTHWMGPIVALGVIGVGEYLTITIDLGSKVVTDQAQATSFVSWPSRCTL